MPDFKSRRKASQPKSDNAEAFDKIPVAEDGRPVLSLHHLQRGFHVEDLADDQCASFLKKWAKRSTFTWTELGTHDKHGLGFEMLPKKIMKPVPPESLQQDKYMVFRHHGNLPFVGFKAGDTFHVLWIEASYDDVYKH